MIQLLCGENDYELTQKLGLLKQNFDGIAERYEGAGLTNEQLADVFAGQTLFATKRLVIIDTPSANSELWQNMATWVGRLSSDIQLVLVEPKPDKRTATYKWLKKNADVHEFLNVDERDMGKVIQWLETYAKQQNVSLTTKQLRHLIDRGGVSQPVLAQAIDKLSLVNTITDEWLNNVIEPNLTENVFSLFETALSGDVKRLAELLGTLRLTEDPYRVFGLVASQAQLVVLLVHGNNNSGQVAADTGAKSSYPLQKMAPFAARMSKSQASNMIHLFADADIRLKSSDANPWLVLESTLVQIASL